MSHEKSHAAILIGASEIRSAESAIQEFAQKVPDPLSRKPRRGLGTRLYDQGYGQGGSGGSAEPPSKLMIFMTIVMPWKN